MNIYIYIYMCMELEIYIVGNEMKGGGDELGMYCTLREGAGLRGIKLGLTVIIS